MVLLNDLLIWPSDHQNSYVSQFFLWKVDQMMTIHHFASSLLSDFSIISSYSACLELSVIKLWMPLTFCGTWRKSSWKVIEFSISFECKFAEFIQLVMIVLLQWQNCFATLLWLRCELCVIFLSKMIKSKSDCCVLKWKDFVTTCECDFKCYQY